MAPPPRSQSRFLLRLPPPHRPRNSCRCFPRRPPRPPQPRRRHAPGLALKRRGQVPASGAWPPRRRPGASAGPSHRPASVRRADADAAGAAGRPAASGREARQVPALRSSVKARRPGAGAAPRCRVRGRRPVPGSRARPAPVSRTPARPVSRSSAIPAAYGRVGRMRPAQVRTVPGRGRGTPGTGMQASRARHSLGPCGRRKRCLWPGPSHRSAPPPRPYCPACRRTPRPTSTRQGQRRHRHQRPATLHTRPMRSAT